MAWNGRSEARDSGSEPVPSVQSSRGRPAGSFLDKWDLGSWGRPSEEFPNSTLTILASPAPPILTRLAKAGQRPPESQSSPGITRERSVS